jgi:hypothetical protein
MNKREFAQKVQKWSMLFFIIPFSSVILLLLFEADFINIPDNRISTLKLLTGVALTFPLFGLIFSLISLSLGDRE